MYRQFMWTLTSIIAFFAAAPAFASEAELKIPHLAVNYNIMGMQVGGTTLLGLGMLIAVAGVIFGLIESMKIKKLPAHKSMLDVSHLIYETCKTYLFTQGKFLVILDSSFG